MDTMTTTMTITRRGAGMDPPMTTPAQVGGGAAAFKLQCSSKLYVEVLGASFSSAHGADARLHAALAHNLEKPVAAPMVG